MSSLMGRTSALVVATCAAVLVITQPVAARVAADVTSAELAAFDTSGEDPQQTVQRNKPERREGSTCALDPGAQTLRKRFIEWWRQNRAISWLSRAVQPAEQADPRPVPPPASYYLRSPLLSGLFVDPASDCGAGKAVSADSAERNTAVVCATGSPCSGPRRGPAL